MKYILVILVFSFLVGCSMQEWREIYLTKDDPSITIIQTKPLSNGLEKCWVKDNSTGIVYTIYFKDGEAWIRY